MRIEEIYARYCESYKIVKDTRDDVSNAMYISLKGASFDGNVYAMQALEKGANYAIIDDSSFLADKRMILVDDTLTCLQELARYHRKQLGLPIIALTGSNGKTTSKELISSVLKSQFNTHATQGNLNNHIGVPLTLLQLRKEHEIAVVEMGANHPGEIQSLCEIALPDYGYITNFGRVHLEGFGSLEGVIQSKTEMYRDLISREKQLFVNNEDPVQLEKSEGSKRVLFGKDIADPSIGFLDADPFVCLEFNGHKVETQLIGAYNYSNIAAAMAIGYFFNVTEDKIISAVKNYVPSNNRSQILNKGKNKIILDAYNANPNSMEVAIDNLSGLTDPHKVAILGDMFEIGDTSIQEHQHIADLVSASQVDTIYLVGELFSQIKVSDSRIRQFDSIEPLKEHLRHRQYQDTTFLIKASRGMALERLTDCI